MRKRLRPCAFALAAALALVAALGGATAEAKKNSEFRQVVRLIESHYGVKHRGLPWFARLAVRVATKFGPLDAFESVKLATFEEQDFSRSAASDAEFGAAMRGLMREGWQPLVEIRSRRDAEQTYVYAKDMRKKFRVLVVTLDGRDGAAVEAVVKPEKLAELLANHHSLGRSFP